MSDAQGFGGPLVFVWTNIDDVAVATSSIRYPGGGEYVDIGVAQLLMNLNQRTDLVVSLHNQCWMRTVE